MPRSTYQMPKASTKSKKHPWSPGLGAGLWQTSSLLQEKGKARAFPLWADGSYSPILLFSSWKRFWGFEVVEETRLFHLDGNLPPSFWQLSSAYGTLNAFSSFWGSNSQQGHQEMSHSLSDLLQQQERRQAPLGSHPTYGIVSPYQITFC